MDWVRDSSQYPWLIEISSSLVHSVQSFTWYLIIEVWKELSRLFFIVDTSHAAQQHIIYSNHVCWTLWTCPTSKTLHIVVTHQAYINSIILILMFLKSFPFSDIYWLTSAEIGFTKTLSWGKWLVLSQLEAKQLEKHVQIVHDKLIISIGFIAKEKKK